MTVASSEGPYVGLRPFETEDSQLFFGRLEQTTELLETLYDNRFIGVVGSSGCGKSSLIKAGVVPALKGGFLLHDRDRWRVARLTPGDSPMRNLATALSDAGLMPKARREALADEIDDHGVHAITDAVVAAVPGDENLLIVVDQFEEVFAFRGRTPEPGDPPEAVAERREQTRRRAEAADFVDLLLALSTQKGAPIYIVLTMRSDFLGDCDVFYGLPEAMNRGRYLVPRLTRPQLKEAIEGPAKLGGASVSRRLVDRLLNELGDRFDRLPVLQHALMRTWERWSAETGATGSLDIDQYEHAGTLSKALATHADELLRDLPRESLVGGKTGPEGEAEFLRIVGRIFQTLTETDPANRQVRRYVRLSEIVDETGLEKEQVLTVLASFRRAGFVVGNDDADPLFGLSHESLIRQWQQLATWVNAERDSRDHYLELIKFARGEREGARALLRDPDLQTKLNWWKRTMPRPAWALRYSKDANDLRHAHEYLERSRKGTNRNRAIRIGSVATAVLALTIATGVALRGWNRAAMATTEAKAQSTLATERAAELAIERDNATRRTKEAEAATRRAEEATTAARSASDRARAAYVQLLREQQRAERASNEATASSLDARASRIALTFSTGANNQDALWQLALGDDALRANALIRILTTDATPNRFLYDSSGLLHALLLYGPVNRAEAMTAAFVDGCLNRASDRFSDRWGVCAILAEEIGHAPPHKGKEQAADAIVAQIAAQERSGEASAPWLAYVVALDDARLDRAVGSLLETRSAAYVIGNLGNSLESTLARVQPAARRRFADKLLKETSEHASVRDLRLHGILDAEQRRTMVARVANRWTTLAPYEKVALGQFVEYLTDDQVLEIALELLRGRGQPDMQLLSALAPRLRSQALDRLVEVLVLRIKDPSGDGDREAHRLAIAVLRERLNDDQRGALARALADALDAAKELDRASGFALTFAELEADNEGARVFAPALLRAAERLNDAALVTRALGTKPAPELVSAIQGWLSPQLWSSTNFDASYRLRRTFASMTPVLTGDAFAAHLNLVLGAAKAADRTARYAPQETLTDVLESAAENQARTGIDRVLAEMRRTEDVDYLRLLAEPLADVVGVMTEQQARAAVARLLEAMKPQQNYGLMQLGPAAARISARAGDDLRQRVADTLAGGLQQAQDPYSRTQLASALAPLADKLDERTWNTVSQLLLAELEESSKRQYFDASDPAVTAVGVAAARLSPAQKEHVLKTLLGIDTRDLADRRMRVIRAIARFVDGTGDDTRRTISETAMEWLLDAERALSGPSLLRNSYSIRSDVPEVAVASAVLVDPRDRARAADVLVRLLAGNMLDLGGNSMAAADLQRFAERLEPSTRRRLSNAILTWLDYSRSPADILDVVLRFPTSRREQTQLLVDALKWPTISGAARVALETTLSRIANVSPDVVADRWKFAEWMKREGYDTGLPTRPQ